MQYVSPEVAGFTARVKYRLTDFVVQEWTDAGDIVPLSIRGLLLPAYLSGVNYYMNLPVIDSSNDNDGGLASTAVWLVVYKF